MKHTASRELYAYWNKLRGLRSAPERSEIDPGAIRTALGDTLILAREPGKETTFRLAGTRVCALFGRELKGDALQPLWNDRSWRELNELLDHAAEESAGFIAGVTGELADGTTVALELLILPLAQRGSPDGRLIGVLAPALPPTWLGIHPVRSLRLGGWRYVGPQIEDAVVPRLVDLPPEPARQMGFIVHGSQP
jgi:hypothetical protein